MVRLIIFLIMIVSSCPRQSAWREILLGDSPAEAVSVDTRLHCTVSSILSPSLFITLINHYWLLLATECLRCRQCKTFTSLDNNRHCTSSAPPCFIITCCNISFCVADDFLHVLQMNCVLLSSPIVAK